MIVLKWILGILIGLAIIVLLSDWKKGENDYTNLVVTIIFVLIEIVIIKG